MMLLSLLIMRMPEYSDELYLFTEVVGDAVGLRVWCEAFHSCSQLTWCVLVVAPTDKASQPFSQFDS